jgi:hypothetical protein
VKSLLAPSGARLAAPPSGGSSNKGPPPGGTCKPPAMRVVVDLSRHLMDIIFVKVKLLCNLRIGQVKTHQIQTQNPDAKRLMMTGKDGAG